MIKSFTIDHTKLEAPCIRLADIYEKNGVTVDKYDLRFVKPNTTWINDDVIHSMEHLLATAFKEVFGDDMIDLSPMGCKTGFYCTLFETTNEVERIKKAIAKAKEIEIPKPTRENCGSYLLHDIKTAREFIGQISNEINNCSN